MRRHGFFRSKRPSSFKDKKAEAPTTDVSPNTDLSLQRSASLFELPVPKTPVNRQVYDQANAGATASSLWEIRSFSGDSPVAHSRSPGEITNPLQSGASASSSVRQLSENFEQRPPAFSSMHNIPKASNIKSSAKPGTKIPLFSPKPSAGRTQVKKSTDIFESFNILNEAIEIFQSLSLDISQTFDTISKSPALPPVIEKYSKSVAASCHGSETTSGLGSNTASGQDITKTDLKQGLPRIDDGTKPKPPSGHERSMETLATLQLRCLEYRVLVKEYTESILDECKHFTESSLPHLKSLSDSISSLSVSFSDFKDLCKKQLKNAESERFLDIFNDFVQVMYLHTLEGQNENYLTRLQSGVNLMKAHCKLVQNARAASLREEALIKEIECIRRTSLGCRV